MSEEISVMLADDEMLVLEDTKSLIDWGEHGCRLVGAAMDGCAAWELYQRERPQVVIADICMPMMDGLALSKKILDTGDNVVVLLLTSHENFRFARDAIELGVQRYLLKHEMSAELLLEVLDSARKHLEKEAEQRARQKQQAFRKLLSLDHEKDEEAATGIVHDPSLLVFLQERPGFSPLGRGNDRQEQDPSDFAEQVLAQAGYRNCVITPVGPAEVAILLPIYSNSELEILECTHQILEQFTRLAEEILQAPVTLFYELLRSDRKRLSFYMCEWSRCSKYTIFEEDPKASLQCSIAEYAANTSDEPVEANRFLGVLQQVEDALENDRADHLEEVLKGLFGLLCARPPRKYGDFTWIAARLEAIRLRSLRAQGIHGSIEKRAGEFHEQYWYNVRQAEEWFRDQFLQMIHERTERASSGYSKKLLKAQQYIRDHYVEELSLERVANAVGISGIYLSQIFKRETGQTFVEYLTNYRIEMSKKLLEKAEYKIYQVSELAGFKSNQYFSNVFRKITGVSPLDYRDSKRR